MKDNIELNLMAIKQKLSFMLLTVLVPFHIFASLFWIEEMLSDFFKTQWFIFYDSEFNTKFRPYVLFAIEYSIRMWLFIPITIFIFIFIIFKNIRNFKLKYNHRFLILAISIIILILVTISTVGDCYGWWDYWAHESV